MHNMNTNQYDTCLSFIYWTIRGFFRAYSVLMMYRIYRAQTDDKHQINRLKNTSMPGWEHCSQWPAFISQQSIYRYFSFEIIYSNCIYNLFRQFTDDCIDAIVLACHHVKGHQNVSFHLFCWCSMKQCSTSAMRHEVKYELVFAYFLVTLMWCWKMHKCMLLFRSVIEEPSPGKSTIRVYWRTMKPMLCGKSVTIQ